MVQHTPSMNLPYVVGADTVSSYPTVSQELAVTLDRTGKFASGKNSATTPPAVPGVGSVAVTFPVGRFTVAPVVQTTPDTAGGQAGYTWVQSVSTTGVTLVWYQAVGTPAGKPVHWLAHQAGAVTTAVTHPMADSETPTTEITVTCPNPQCENYDQPITLTVPVGVGRCECGPCGTDLTAQFR